MKKSLEERLDLAEKKLQQESFRENKGLGNEVGYYIFDYPPGKELYVRERIREIIDRNHKLNDEYPIIQFDLYDMIIEILKKKGFLEKCFEFEKKNGFERITKAISSMLRITMADNLIIRHIKENTPEHSIVFITGIGKCYPILRSHTVLNQLHQIVDYVPVVLFYPGQYNGRELVLFGKIKDDNYYRAFPLVD